MLKIPENILDKESCNFNLIAIAMFSLLRVLGHKRAVGNAHNSSDVTKKIC